MRWLLSGMEVEVEHEIVERPLVSNLQIHTHISFLLFLSFIPPPSPRTLINTLPERASSKQLLLCRYIGVGDSDESQLFYYFVESQRRPASDPLLLWLTGGPGCSALSAFFYQSGPVEFDYSNYNGSLPSLHLNPNTWTKEINMLYVDAPVGTGFSYSTLHNYTLDDNVSTTQTYQFLQKNTTGVWKRCNLNYINGIDYKQTVLSTIDYHRNLSKYDLRALIYSGDHDSFVPHIGTENWIQLLNLTVNEYWRPWFVDGQVAGYTEKFINGGYTLIYATVKGGGHIAPEYKPKECYSMIDRWMGYYPL